MGLINQLGLTPPSCVDKVLSFYYETFPLVLIALQGGYGLHLKVLPSTLDPIVFYIFGKLSI